MEGKQSGLIKRMGSAGGRDLLLDGWSRTASHGGGL